jgi:hypothetical protein
LLNRIEVGKHLRYSTISTTWLFIFNGRWAARSTSRYFTLDPYFDSWDLSLILSEVILSARCVFLVAFTISCPPYCLCDLMRMWPRFPLVCGLDSI